MRDRACPGRADESRDIIRRVAAGETEYSTPDDAYATTLACLAADLSGAWLR